MMFDTKTSDDITIKLIVIMVIFLIGVCIFIGTEIGENSAHRNLQKYDYIIENCLKGNDIMSDSYSQHVSECQSKSKEFITQYNAIFIK